ncbi:MAG: SLBB domain-containing protein [Actinomycetota bacterium]
MARPYYWGLFARPPDENPTAVNNVETLSNVAPILAEGPDWLRQWGTEASPGPMCFTVAGDVEREGVWELPMGATLRELLEAAGGVPEAVKVIFPGASSTALVPAQLETPLSFEHMAAVGSGSAPAGSRCTRRPSSRGLVLPKIVDWDEDAGRFTYDESYTRKRPDWTYA